MSDSLTTRHFQKLISRGAFSQAIAELNGVVRDEPDRPDAWCYLGIAYTEAGHPTEAIGALFAALDRGRRTCEIPEALGCAYLRRGDLDAAEYWYLTALRETHTSGSRYDPRAASILRNLAILMRRRGRREEARFLLAEARDAALSLHEEHLPVS